jgi:glycerate 2-kinase
MKVIIAPQAFKGTLSPFEAAEAMKVGVLRVFPNSEICMIPVADGGDGTLEILIGFKHGSFQQSIVSGPLGDPVNASWGMINEGKTAVIELAKVCGLTMLQADQRNPLLTTTFGLGELIKIALDKGIRQFIIGIGGSVTNDAGAGLAMALGIKFLDKSERELPLGGGALEKLSRLDLSHIDPRIKQSTFIVGCDVINPLLGPNGATMIYGPQKGGTPEQIIKLEHALTHFADNVQRDVGKNVHQMPYGGAAGGTGAGLAVFLGASLESGITMVMDQLNFEKQLEDADLLITGEGCVDSQTLFNKSVLGVAEIAKRNHIPVIAVVGIVKGDISKLYLHGIQKIVPTSFVPQYSGHLPSNAFELLSEATENALI